MVVRTQFVARAEPGPAGLEQIVRWYLSAHHRDNPLALLDVLSPPSSYEA
jgi:hypothetical protein